MAFISVSEFATKRGTHFRGGSRVSEGLLFACDRSGDKQRKSIRFRIGSKLVSDARFMAGDRVDILFDPSDRMGLIKRVKDGGWALSIPGGGDAKKKKQNSLNVKFCFKPGMPITDSSVLCESVSVTGEGILFRFPDSVDFTSEI